MNRTGLPARTGYAVAALVAGAAIGFYASVWLLPKVTSPDADAFTTAIEIGAIVAFTAALLGLTLPWMRRKRRSGRGRRVAISSAIVVIASLLFADQGHAIGYDLAFAAWLSYVMAFTYVRYGVRDREKRRVSSDAGSSSKLVD